MKGIKGKARWAATAAVGLSASGLAALAAGPTAPAPKPPAAPAAQPVAPPGARPATGPVGDKARKTVEVLVAQGLDTLALGDIKGARDLFADVLQIDPRNRKSLEGLGYCYIKLDDMPRASRALEGALAAPAASTPGPVPTGSAATTGPATAAAPSRSLTINLAMSLLRNRNTVRGATMLRDYLAATPSAVDEEALNALAICLDQSSKEARAGALYKNLVTFYETANAKLEATKPGQKRWGIEWIPEDDWKQKDEHNKKTQSQMDLKWRQYAAARDQAASAQAAYENGKIRARRQRVPNLVALEAEARRTGEIADKYKGEYDDVAAKLLRPTFPKLFAAVPLETPTALASAAVPDPAAAATGTDPAAAPVLRPPQLARVDSPPAAGSPPSDATASPPAATPTEPSPEAVVPPAPARRKRFTYAAGFAVTSDLMVTAAAAVEGTSRISVQAAGANPVEAEVVRADPASGLALIKLKGGRLPSAPLGDAFAGGPVTCTGFPTPAIFDPQAEPIAGTATPPKEKWTVRLSKHPRLAGAPILSGGKVVGVELATRDSEAANLPAATLQQLRALVGNAPLPAGAAAGGDGKASVALVSGVR